MSSEFDSKFEIPNWEYPDGELKLSQGVVHLWRLRLDQFPSRMEYLNLGTSFETKSGEMNPWDLSTINTLSKDEVDRIKKFRFAKDKRKYLIRRGGLRSILANYVSIQPVQIQFDYNAAGKPFLDSTQNSGNIQFNMTDSFDIALYAVCLKNRLGVDLEKIGIIEDAERIAERFFAPEEYGTLKDLPAEDKQIAFFNGWTRKEALLKALGSGIGKSLDKFEVSLSPAEPAEVRSIDGDSQKAKNWSLVSFNPSADYVAALAVEGEISEIRYLDCPADWVKEIKIA